MANFLSSLTPDWFNSVMGNPGTQGMPAYAADPMGAAPISRVPDVPNLLQSLNTGAFANDAPQTAPTTAPDAPRPRRSILDTIGRVADVLAKVGGADALYQPTLDAREDRTLALGDHARQVDLEKLKIATTQGTLDDAGRARLAQAVRGTQALLAANPQADVSKVFPLLAARAGVDPAQTATLAGQLAQDPTLLDGLAGFDDSGDKYGGSVVYAKGPDGKIVAFQPNLKGGKGRPILPDGFTAVDPLKIVDTGGAQVGINPRTGETVTTIGKTQSPDNAANNATRVTTTGMNNRTAITVAGMPARAKPGATADKSDAGNSEALIALDNLENGFKDLHRLNALPGDNGGAVNNVLSALGRTGPGQFIGEQAGSAAAQKRVAMQKTVNTLQQTLIKALPASATRTKFEQEILAKSLPDPTRMSLSTAQSVIADYRAIFKRAQAAAAAERSTSGGARTLPPRLGAPTKPVARKPAGKPTVSNW